MKNKYINVLFIIMYICFFNPIYGYAQHIQPPPTNTTQTPASVKISTAAGFTSLWLSGLDFGQTQFYRYIPEGVAYAYIPAIKDALYFRLGLRIARSTEEPLMAKLIQIHETENSISLDLGLVAEGYFLPSLAFLLKGSQVSYKTTTILPVQEQENIQGRYYFMSAGIQLGLGIPIFDGALVFEPFFRYLIGPSWRQEFKGGGLETTLQIF